MNRLVIALVAAILFVSGCKTLTAPIGAYTSFKTAPVAYQLLTDYIQDDEAIQAEIDLHLNALADLYHELESVDSAQTLAEFVITHPDHIQLATYHWIRIKETLSAYSERTGRVIPLSLVAWSEDVEVAANELFEAIEANQTAVQVAQYVRVILKILAARNGVIL